MTRKNISNILLLIGVVWGAFRNDLAFIALCTAIAMLNANWDEE